MKLRHVPALDGLRGVAVLGVLFFHANGLLRGGYLGVDLFFVLSGFLITSILLDEHSRTKRIDLRMFWVRRARRLLPALLGLMPAIALYARVFAVNGTLERLRTDAFATMAYVANWNAIFARRSYWEMFSAPSPLEHTWSLAIEEQFYVFWPLLVAGVLRLAARLRSPGAARAGAQAMFFVCAALGLASSAAMALLYENGDTTRVYLGTDTRGAAILAGAALACTKLGHVGTDGTSLTPVQTRVLNALGLASMVFLGVAWARLDGESPRLYRGGFWATELAVLILLVSAVRSPEGPTARALSLRPLRAVGQISYGAYLWHWPLYVVLTEERTKLAGFLLLAVRLASTFAVAWVSYRLIEKPIRERGIPWGRPLFVVPAVLAFTIGLLVYFTSAKFGQAKEAANPDQLPAEFEMPRTGSVDAGADQARPPPLNTFLMPSEMPKGAVRLLVLGDSVGLSLGMQMYWDRRENDPYVVQRAVGDCSILDSVAPTRSKSGGTHWNGDCSKKWLADVAELRPDIVLVVIGGAFYSTVKVEGRWRSVCDQEWHSLYAKRLAELLKQMAPFTSRLVVALTPYPVGKWQSPTLESRVDCYLHSLRDAATEGNAYSLDLAEHLCPNGACALTSQGAPIRPDGLHFSGTGATEITRWVLDTMREMAPSRMLEASDASTRDL